MPVSWGTNCFQESTSWQTIYSAIYGLKVTSYFAVDGKPWNHLATVTKVSSHFQNSKYHPNQLASLHCFNNIRVFFFCFFFYESLCKKKQGIQDSIANEKYPDYKSPNKMTRKLILKLNLWKCGYKSIFETSRGSCIGYITGQSIPIRNSVRHKWVKEGVSVCKWRYGLA